MMNQENFNRIRQSVVAQSTTDDDKLLESLRITTDTQLEPEEFLFRVFGKSCFPRREVCVVSGKAKSGKSLFNSLLMACCACDEVLQIQRPDRTSVV